jgi:TnpA family transposase
LDAILDKKTGLENRGLTTGGNTGKLFALFDLLRMQFSPRLPDIGNYTLYRNDPSIKYKRINPLLSHKPLKTALFVDDWNELPRLADSRKIGWAPAYTFIGKLKAYPRQHKLTRTLVEYGHLIRSAFVIVLLLPKRLAGQGRVLSPSYKLHGFWLVVTANGS